MIRGATFFIATVWVYVVMAVEPSGILPDSLRYLARAETGMVSVAHLIYYNRATGKKEIHAVTDRDRFVYNQIAMIPFPRRCHIVIFEESAGGDQLNFVSRMVRVGGQERERLYRIKTIKGAFLPRVLRVGISAGIVPWFEYEKPE